MNSKIKIILIILVTAVLAGISWFIWSRQTQPKTETAGSTLRKVSQSQTNSPSPAIIILSTPKTTVSKGEVFTVSINISSKNRSAGTDIIMLYDPTLLSVEEDNSGKPVQVGSIYQEYPVNKDDKKGKIIVSGISSQTEGNLASGLFGTVNFKAKTAGKTTINLDFTKGLTTDSNVTASEDSADMLEAIQNVEVLVN